MFAKFLFGASAACLWATAGLADDVAAKQPIEVTQSSETFALCMNAKFYNEGSVIDVEGLAWSDGDSRSVETAKGAFRFGGKNTIAIERRTISSFDSKKFNYYALRGSSVLSCGEKIGKVKAVVSPPQIIFHDLKVGQSFSQDYAVKISGDGDIPPNGKVSWAINFIGFESLRTKLGLFKTCKLSTKHVLRMDLSSSATKSDSVRAFRVYSHS